MKAKMGNQANLPKVLLVGFTMCITLFTYHTFFRSPPYTYSFFDIFFYFSPTIFLILLLKFGWDHVRFLEIMTYILSFQFLIIYPVYVSLTAFLFLIFVATLFLVDDFKNNHKFGKT